jgi:hypothetical protein
MRTTTLSTFDKFDAGIVRRDLRKLSAKYSEGIVDAAEIVNIADDVSDNMTTPAIEYWGEEARKQRANKATKTQMARLRNNKK